VGLAGLLRALWRQRIAVGAGALLAILVAIAGMQRAAGGATAVSSSIKVLIDTPNSLVVDAKARGSMTIDSRAQLLGSLMAEDRAKLAIARGAGLRPSELAVVESGAAASPNVVTPLAEQAVAATMPASPYLVSIEIDPNLPILSIAAVAPTRDRAGRLGRVAFNALPSVARRAPGGDSGMRIERLGRPLVAVEAAEGGRVKAVGGALVFFILWCLGCVLLDGVLRRRAPRRVEWSEPRGMVD
jgi:hypothetical protein